MKTFVLPIDWLIGVNTGWGNGYVIIPKDHKLYGVNYDHINVDVHGGLTFAQDVGHLKNNDHWKDSLEGIDEGWVVGFDTAHYQDNSINCSKEFVLAETERLKEQLMNYSE